MTGGPLPTPSPISEPYWEGTKKGELRLCHCKRCGALFRFIRELCPKCWSPDLDWHRSSGQGTVIARAVVHNTPYESMADRTPYVLALVELSEGVTMMSNIVDCDPDTVEIGMPVTVLFEERGEFAIPQFRPILPRPADQA